MERGWLVVCLALAGCVKTNAVECSNGVVCPYNTTCDIERGLCLLPGQLEACSDKAEGAACEFGDVAGVCYMGLCTMATCGDSTMGPGEVCDDGNLTSNDGCRNDCRSDEKCGNGIIDFHVGERCDCGKEGSVAMGCAAANSDTNAASSCRLDCALRCGDLMVQPGEVCDGSAPANRTCIDYGFDTGVLACNGVCGPSFAGCDEFGWVPTDAGVMSAQVRGIWGLDASNIFAVGMLGLIVHFDGTTWSKMGPPALPNLTAVWGRSASDVYAAGDGAILHYDGSAWTVVNTGINIPPGTVFRAITGNATNVYVAGGGLPQTDTKGIILRFAGNAWTVSSQNASASLNTLVINAAGTHVVAAGASNDVLGATIGTDSWSPLGASGPGATVWSGGFATGNEIYLVGDNGMWKSISAGGPFTINVGPWGGGAIPNKNLKAVWGSSATNMVVLGNLAYHWDGSVATVMSEGFVPNEALWGTALDNLWAGGTGLRHFEGTTWSDAPSGVTTHLHAASAGPPGVYAVGDGGVILRFAGGAWSAAQQDSASGGSCQFVSTQDVVGVSVGTDVVAGVTSLGTLLLATAGNPTFFACSTGGATNLFDVWVKDDATHDAFAVSVNSQIFRRSFSGPSITPWVAMPAVVWNGTPPNPQPILQTIHGFAANDIFAGGANGVIVHWNGAAWTAMTTSTISEITEIWGPAPDNVFAVGSLGTILHYDGSTWTKMESGTIERLDAVWGTSAADVFATGGDTLLHYDGTRWIPMRDVTLEAIRGLTGAGPRLFGVGTNGASTVLLRY